jgi:hypothetical protein
VTLHASDLLLILAMIVGGLAATYLLVLRRITRLANERELKIADQLGALNDAIQTLETRLTEHHTADAREVLEIAAGAEGDSEAEAGESVAVAPEIKAAIAAAAVAALGQNAAVKSVKQVSSPWTQQGRMIVQGSHNLRVQR